MTDTSNLPHALSLVAEDCGLEEAFALASTLGGKRIYIPENPEDSTLADRVGPNVAASLSRHYAGEYLDVPQVSDRLRSAQREAWILAHPKATVNETAQALGMSRTGAQGVRRRVRQRLTLETGRKPRASRKEETSARP